MKTSVIISSSAPDTEPNKNVMSKIYYKTNIFGHTTLKLYLADIQDICE